MSCIAPVGAEPTPSEQESNVYQYQLLRQTEPFQELLLCYYCARNFTFSPSLGRRVGIIAASKF